MGVSLNTALPVIAWSKNPIVLKLYSDDYLTTAPAFSVNTVSFTGAVSAGDVIGLSWNAGSAGMTAAAVPDISGDQFPTGDGSAAYVISLVDYFQDNYFIDQAFTVSADTTGTPKLVFTAKVASTDYDITPGTNQAVATPGTSGSTKANFMHHIEVWKHNPAGADVKVYDNNIALDEPKTGTTTIDISETLHSFMDWDLPSLTGTYWQACPGSCWKYYIKFAQFYGDDPSVKKLNKTGLYTVVFGGYSNLALQQINDRVNYLAKYLLPAPALYTFQRWLESWPIDEFTVKTNQPLFLSFVNNRSVDELFKIRIDIKYDDSSSQTVFLPGDTIQAMGKIAVGAGYQQLGLQQYTSSTKKVSAYQLRLVEASSLESRSLVKTITVNREYEEYTRYFVYGDSAGNFKTLHTYGRSKTTMDVEYDLTAFQPDITFLPEQGNYRNSNIKAVLNDQVSTGYIVSRSSFDPFVEIQMSRQLYRVFGNRLTPIVGTTKSFPFSQDGQNLSVWVFEYRMAYDEELYTADSYALPIPQFNQSQQPVNDI